MRELMTAEGLACPSGAAGDTAALEKLCEILDALEDLDVTIDGNVSVDIESAPIHVPFCLNGCEQISACYVKNSEGDLEYLGYIDQTGSPVDAALPDDATLGDCPPAFPKEVSVWTVDFEAEECEDQWQFVEIVTVLTIGFNEFVLVDGVKVPFEPEGIVRPADWCPPCCDDNDTLDIPCVKETRSLWTFDDDGCMAAGEVIDVLCCGFDLYVQGEDGPVLWTAPAGVIVMDGDYMPPNECIPCPVDPQDAYGEGEVTGLTVWSESEYDCDTGEWAPPTVVTWGDVDIPVTPDCPWTLPNTCGDAASCNTKPITITGPHTQRAWVYELKEC